MKFTCIMCFVRINVDRMTPRSWRTGKKKFGQTLKIGVEISSRFRLLIILPLQSQLFPYIVNGHARQFLLFCDLVLTYIPKNLSCCLQEDRASMIHHEVTEITAHVPIAQLPATTGSEYDWLTAEN